MPINQDLPLGPVPMPGGDNIAFAKVDVAIVAWLIALGFQSVGSDGPDKARSWPHIMVTKLPTGTSSLYEDSSIVDVEVFHPDYNAAADASGVVHFWLTDPVKGLRDNEVNGQKVDDVRGPTPGYQDYEDPQLKRFMSSYRVDSRPINPL